MIRILNYHVITLSPFFYEEVNGISSLTLGTLKGTSIVLTGSKPLA